MGEMRWIGITCACALAFAGVARANPGDARDKYREAVQLAASDDNEKALALVTEALGLAPKDLQLLQLQGTLLLKMRDYEGALTAYQSYIDAGATGANRRTAQKIVASLGVVKSTFIDLTVTSGPAQVYLDSKTAGVFCVADPGCKRGVLPGDYKVIVERAGFDRWTKRITVDAGHVAKVAVALAEKPSEVTVHVAQDGAQIAIDGKPVTGSVTLAGGDHELVVELARFATERRTIAAHEGKPVAVDVSLTALVPIAMTTPAELALDGAKLAVVDGAVALPAGAHVLVAHADGFHDAKLDVPAERGADYKIAIELRPIGALVDVAGAPAGTALVVDGKAIATTPLAAPLELAAGTHEVELRASGYLPYHDRRAFPANQAVHLRLSHLRPDTRRNTYLAAAGTGAALVLGGVTSWLALDRGNQFDARAKLAGVTSSDPDLLSLKSSGEHYALAADVGFGLAIAGIAVTTYLFRHEGRGESEGSIQIGIGAGTAMLSGRF